MFQQIQQYNKQQTKQSVKPDTIVKQFYPEISKFGNRNELFRNTDILNIEDAILLSHRNKEIIQRDYVDQELQEQDFYEANRVAFNEENDIIITYTLSQNSFYKGTKAYI